MAPTAPVTEWSRCGESCTSGQQVHYHVAELLGGMTQLRLLCTCSLPSTARKNAVAKYGDTLLAVAHSHRRAGTAKSNLVRIDKVIDKVV